MRLRIICVSRYLAVDGMSGHNTYLREVLEGLNSADCEITYLWLDGPLFFRPWWPMPAGAVRVTRLICHRHLRLGRFFFPASWKLWRAGVTLVAANRWRRSFPKLSGQRVARIQVWAEAVFEQSRNPFHANVSRPSPPEIEWFRKMVRATRPDAVILNYAYLSSLSVVAHEFGLRAVVLTHDVVHQLHATLSQRGIGQSPMDARAEAKMVQAADLLVAIQADEADELRRLAPGSEVITVPMPQRIVMRDARQEVASLLFVGSGTAPNLDGLQWFVREVWGRVRASFPQAQLRVCGSVCDTASEAAEGVQLLGRVDDLAPEYARATVCIAPLLCGSGLKIKVVEAWGHGRAVVGTPIALQGLAEFEGKCALRAVTPAEFAGAIIHLLQDADRRRKMEANAVKAIEGNFSPAAALSPLLQWLHTGGREGSQSKNAPAEAAS